MCKRPYVFIVIDTWKYKRISNYISESCATVMKFRGVGSLAGQTLYLIAPLGRVRLPQRIRLAFPQDSGGTYKMCTSYVKFNCVWASIKYAYKYFQLVPPLHLFLYESSELKSVLKIESSEKGQ